MSFLPLADRDYLSEKGIPYTEVESAGQKGIILTGYSLPPGRFNSDTADILIVLQSGYPDMAPDMFYTNPWLTLVPENRYANAADQPFDFNGVRWQRWSRHNSEWRSGNDGIRTMILRIQNALEVAK